MTLRKPLVINAGRIEQLQDVDLLDPDGSGNTNDNAGALVIGTPVYIKATGNVDKAKADAEATSFVAGFVKDASIASGASGQIQSAGVLEATTTQWDAVTGGSGGLTPGAYFLSETTAGQITTVEPTNGFVVRVGIAVSTTRMAVQIGVPAQELDAPLSTLVHAGRLTVATGSPFATGSTSTIYFTPTLGNTVPLYNGTRWVLHNFAEISVAVPSHRFRAFDCFVYDNAGTITLETQDWTTTSGTITGATNATPIVITSNGHGLSNNDLVAIVDIVGNTAANDAIWQIANVTANTFELLGSTGNGAYVSGGTWIKVSGQSNSGVTTQDGVIVDSVDTAKRYVGSGFTGSTSGQVTTGNTELGLTNQDNEAKHAMLQGTTVTHTYTSTTIRPWNDDGKLSVYFMTPIGRRNDVDVATVSLAHGDGSAECATFVGVDGINGPQAGLISTRDSVFNRMNGMGLSFSSTGQGIRVFYSAERRLGGAGTATYNQLFFRLRTGY